MNFKVEKSEILYKGKVFNLQVDQIIYNNGIGGVRETAIHPGGAVVIPVKDDGKIIMITQYRYPINKVIIEFPAGKLDNNEDPLKCAVRELEEETGYIAERITKLGTICTAPGFCSELLHLYLANELTPGNLSLEEGEEGIEVVEFSVKEIEEKIRSGEIYDSKSICAFHLAANHLNQ